MPSHFLEEVDRLIRARYPLLYVVTWEEERARKYFMALAESHGKSLYEWSITDGFRRMLGPKDAPRRTSGRTKRWTLPAGAALFRAVGTAAALETAVHRHAA